jgi:WD40 repeat protein
MDGKNGSRPWGKRLLGVTLTALVALMLVVPPASHAWIYPYDPLEEAYMKEVESWAHPDGEGADLRINFSRDHSMLLLVGYGAPGEVRVMDRNMTTLAVLEPPHEGFMAKDASWAMDDSSVMIWGRAPSDINDTMAMYDVPSFVQNTTSPWIALVDLPQIDSVGYHAYNVIMSVAGRDAHGTSRLLFIEVEPARIHRNIEHPGNHTIVTVGDDGGMVIIADSGGNIDIITGGDWTVNERFEGALEGGATAWYIPRGGPWGLGGARGRVVVQSGFLQDPTPALTIGPGPIQGFTWTMGRDLDFIAAIPRSGGGSRLVAWQVADELHTNGTAGPICHLDTTAGVTMMEPEPGGRGRVLVAFDDGTLGAFRLVIRPRPTGIWPGDPDEPDGKGLESFRKWRHESGEGDFLNIAFNHQGTLILLRGYAGVFDARVVNRTMETVTVLDPPFNEGPPAGAAWSMTDRYLVAWGEPDSVDGPLTMVYDVPSFKKSKELDLGWIGDHIHVITSMEFLSGDDILAVGGSVADENAILVFDLEKKKVLAEHRFRGGEPVVDLHLDGEDLLAITFDGVMRTLSPPDWRIDRTGISIHGTLSSSDAHGDSGWLAIGEYQNLSIFTGDPREPIVEIQGDEGTMYAVAWTLVDGDLVFAVERPHGGTSIQLWQTRDRPGLEGVQAISQINTTKTVVDLAADPAHPGLFAAGFVDGTFALYSLNLTPYPPPPEELAGEDIGPINGTGNQGNGEVEPQTLADFAYIIGIVVVIALLLVLLVWLKRGEDEEEED